MNNFISRLRNNLEANNRVSGLEFRITQSWAYKKLIYTIAKRKIVARKKSKCYNFALETSSFCNGKCFFCPNGKMLRKKENMSTAMVKKLIKRIKEEGITPLQFNLTGTGEPLIDKELFIKINLLKSNFPDSVVYFPTNLALADEKIINKIVKSKLDRIAVSLNANNAVDYKKIMGLDYKKTIENLENLIRIRNKLKSPLKIYITLAANPVNKASVNDFLKKWENKVDGIGINWIHSWAGAVKNGDKNKKKLVRHPCRPLFEQIIVHSNGNIPLCLVDYEGKVVGGNVMKDKILDAYYSKEMEKVRAKHLSGDINSIKMCSNCRFSERGLYWLV